MSGSVDHEARTQAAIANQKIDQHEDHCAERWEEARKETQRLSSRINWLIVTLIGGQASVIGVLVKIVTK